MVPNRKAALVDGRIERMSHSAAMVGCVILALTIAEKRKAACAAIDGGRGRKFVLRRCAEVAGPDNHHAEAVAVTLSSCELRVEQTGGVGRGFCGMAELRE